MWGEHRVFGIVWSSSKLSAITSLDMVSPLKSKIGTWKWDQVQKHLNTSFWLYKKIRVRNKKILYIKLFFDLAPFRNNRQTAFFSKIDLWISAIYDRIKNFEFNN